MKWQAYWHVHKGLLVVIILSKVNLVRDPNPLLKTRFNIILKSVPVPSK
jgi:hypothetical protein